MDYTILTSNLYVFQLDVPGEFIYYILLHHFANLAGEAFLHPFQLLGKLGIVGYPFETYSIHDDAIETIQCALRGNRRTYQERMPFYVDQSALLLPVMSFTGENDRLVFVAQAFVEDITICPVQAHLSSSWPYLFYCFRIPKGKPVELDPYIADVVSNHIQNHSEMAWENGYRFNTSLFTAVRSYVAHQRGTKDPVCGD